ncbi:MAG: FMN-binding protein MioC [Alteromonadaceae bacterium]|nr:FMN-binding protein MioC [Alteromonadaceae bacterium]
MTKVEIIVGSMLGASEYVADTIAAHFSEQGWLTEIHLEPNLADIPASNLWFICSSTHGAGDFPDNIQPFAEQLKSASLNNTEFYLIGLGDTSYDTFCEAGKNLSELMQKAGAKALLAPLYIDVLEHPVPEDYALEWMQENIS